MTREEPRFEHDDWYLLADNDPDVPFAFDDYVTIASCVRHHGRLPVWTASLPYGMWWHELRPQIELRRDLSAVPGTSARSLTGVWTSAETFLARTHPSYSAHAQRYATTSWLDAERSS